MKEGQYNMDYSSFLDFLSTTAIDMTKKIADLELHPAHHRMQEWEASDVASFSIRTSGGFRILLVLCAQRELLREIARRMKRQDKVTSGDVEIYSGEYFNIVCGTFLSHVNNTLHTRTRFNVPCFTEGFYPAKSLDTNTWDILPFECPYGVMELKIRDLDQESAS